MKRIIIIGMICIVLSLLCAQGDMTVEELRQIVQQEQKHLTDLLNEITFLSNLLEKKFTIKAHEQTGEYAKIKELFLKDQQQIDILYQDLNGEQIITYNNELKVIYGNIQSLAPYLLYNDARGSYLIKNYEQSQIYLEEIINEYPSFEKIDHTILLLQEIYFKLGLHKEFVSLYVKASSKNTELQKYWLGHSHYNISNYREAENIFSSLREDKNFGFRSQAMIALIKNYTEGSENSIAEFTKLLKDYPPTTEHYHFALLTLARLYLDTNEPDLALKYYDLYVKYYPTEIPDEILFEIGLMNKNNANYMKAISYFDMILKKPIKSEYYASAKILATISQKQSGEYSELETNLTDIISLNDILLQTLNSKYGLMDKYRDLRNNLKNSENNPAQKESILTQMEQVETLIFNTNKTVENLYKGDDITRLAAISIMEEEYIYYTQTIEMMNSVVELAKTTPNRRIPASIDKKIGIGEKDIIRLTILSFLGHLPEKKITTSDYEFAQTLATEKIYDLQLIDLWQDVNKVAKNVEYEAVALLADKYVSLLQENINSYNAIAKYRFSGAPSDEFKKILDDEIKLVTRNNHEMEILKQSVIESFNKKIAERLDNQKKVLVVENENLRNIYNTVLSNVINDVKQERDKNEFTLLDILFKQSKALDLEYQVKQIELRNNEQIKNSGNE